MSTIQHDGRIHHPLGGASYVFEKEIVGWLLKQTKKDKIRISIGAQPNSLPHFGTLVVFAMAFALGEKINRQSSKRAEVFFEVIDSAPHSKYEEGGVTYQISLRESGEAERNIDKYIDLLEMLKSLTGVPYKLRGQEEFNAHPSVAKILKNIATKKEAIADILDSSSDQKLRMRVACQQCGLTDKYAIKTVVKEDEIESYCPKHGSFYTKYADSRRFEYNTPLRNLIRACLYSLDNHNEHKDFEWLRVTGSDYAGFYQEQLLYKPAALLGFAATVLPIIFYTPLITDWSGAKLSKSLYVQKGAYGDLPSYIVNYGHFMEEFGDIGVEMLYNEVAKWIEEPYRLFRNYSVYYFMKKFKSSYRQSPSEPSSSARQLKQSRLDAFFGTTSREGSIESEVMFSLKPKFADLIKRREKNYEFRKYNPKIPPTKIWFYITTPVASLVYVAEVGQVVKYPDKISADGYGNEDFNQGLKKSKYAFPIVRLYRLKKPLSLRYLRDGYQFIPPQGFVYMKTYKELYRHVTEDIGLDLLFSEEDQKLTASSAEIEGGGGAGGGGEVAAALVVQRGKLGAVGSSGSDEATAVSTDGSAGSKRRGSTEQKDGVEAKRPHMATIKDEVDVEEPENSTEKRKREVLRILNLCLDGSAEYEIAPGESEYERFIAQVNPIRNEEQLYIEDDPFRIEFFYNGGRYLLTEDVVYKPLVMKVIGKRPT